VRLIVAAHEGGDLVNSHDNSGKTALHFAAAAGFAAIIKELAQTDGCDVNAEDPDDR